MARVTIDPAQVREYFKGLKAVEDGIRSITLDDAYQIAYEAKEVLQENFPYSTPVTGRYYERGALTPSERKTHLRTGWRVYPTSLSGSPGFLIQHVNFNNPRVATTLASIDQGSRGHYIYLQRAKAFRFAANRVGPDPVFNRAKSLWIPARKPVPYVEPTKAFIEKSLNELAVQRAQDIADLYARKKTRLERLRTSYAKLTANKIAQDE